MAATDAAGKETADAHEAASAGQPTERNSKGLMPRGVIRVKNQYQARASWKPAGATKAQQRNIGCFKTIPEAAQAVVDAEAMLAAGDDPWAGRPLLKRKYKRGEVLGTHTHTHTLTWP